MPILNKRIKIGYHILPYIIGGTERFLFNLIKYIDKDKFEPIVISHAQGRVTSLFKSIAIKTNIITIGSSRGFKDLVIFLKEYKIDIVQSNYFVYVMAMAAKTANIPHVWRLGGDIRTIARPNFSKQKIKDHIEMISTLSKKIVVPSRFLKHQLKDVVQSKINMIRNGVDIEESAKAYPVHLIKKKLGCSKDSLTVGMPAYLISQKRQVDFILAAKKVKMFFPRIKFFVIGSCYPAKESINYAKYLHKLVSNIGMEDNIIFTGFHKDIFGIISAMDLVVMPSINEGSINAILEAMALGKPTVVSRVGSNSELIKDKVTGLLVPPKNPKKLADAMIKILRDPKKPK